MSNKNIGKVSSKKPAEIKETKEATKVSKVEHSKEVKPSVKVKASKLLSKNHTTNVSNRSIAKSDQINANDIVSTFRSTWENLYKLSEAQNRIFNDIRNQFKSKFLKLSDSDKNKYQNIYDKVNILLYGDSNIMLYITKNIKNIKFILDGMINAQESDSLENLNYVLSSFQKLSSDILASDTKSLTINQLKELRSQLTVLNEELTKTIPISTYPQAFKNAQETLEIFNQVIELLEEEKKFPTLIGEEDVTADLESKIQEMLKESDATIKNEEELFHRVYRVIKDLLNYEAEPEYDQIAFLVGLFLMIMYPLIALCIGGFSMDVLVVTGIAYLTAVAGGSTRLYQENQKIKAEHEKLLVQTNQLFSDLSTYLSMG